MSPDTEIKLTRSELAKRLLDSDSEGDANYDLEQAFLELLDEADRRLLEEGNGEACPINTFLVLAGRLSGEGAISMLVSHYGFDRVRAWIDGIGAERF